MTAFHKPFMYADFYRRAYRVATVTTFDVYHAHDLNTLPVAAAAARATGRPLVYDSHELYPDASGLSRRESFVWRRLEPHLIRRASHVITVCDSIADELVRRYGIGRPEVILNCPEPASPAVSRQSSPLRAYAGLEDSVEPIVLYQGGFAPGRGIDALVQAAAHLRRGVIVLMGWGATEDQIAEEIEARSLGAKVRLVPPVRPEDLLAYTAGADVGVIPYQPVGLNNYYTAPNKLFEYIAAGIPVAGSALPEITHFLRLHGVGVTFDPYDPRDMAITIDRLLADPELRATMGRRAAATATVLNWRCEEDKLLRIYRCIARGDGVARAARPPERP